MGIFEQSRSYIAEGIVEELLALGGVNSIHLIIADKGNRLDERAINLFLRVHIQDNKLIELLKEIHSKGYYLPDLLCYTPKENELWFVEVKSDKRDFKFSDLNKEQKEGFKILAKNGYPITIMNIKFKMELNTNPIDNDYTNKEQGRALKGEIIPKDYTAEFNIKPNELKSSIYEGIQLQEIEVS